MFVSRQIQATILAVLLVLGTSPVSASGQMLGITKPDCIRLVTYVQNPGIDYQEGVDVRGGSVVPPNLGSGVEFEYPDGYVFYIEVDLAQRLGLSAIPESFEIEAPIGILEVHDERLYLNGQPLQDEEEADIAKLCRELLAIGH